MSTFKSTRAFTTNRLLTRCCVGTTIGIFGTWNYADRGVVYNILTDTARRLKSLNLLPAQAQLPDPVKLRAKLTEYCLLKSHQPHNYISWMGAAFSHRDLFHIAFNMITWTSFAPMLYLLPTPHYAALILGSAIASSGLFLYDNRGKRTAGLGSSGIVSGLMGCVTMFAPFAQARLFGIVPAPLWLLFAGYLYIDSQGMQSGAQTGIGHSAHIGGALFGVAYYTLFLRRYGGILGRR